MISLLVRYWQMALLVAALTFGVTEWKLHNAALIREGVAKEKVRRADSTLAVLRQQKKQIEIRWVHDTLNFTRDTGSVHTLTNTVTEWKHDTVAVATYVTKAEEAIKSCSDLFSSCKVRAENAESRVRELEGKTTAIVISSPRSCTVSNVIWGTAGAVGGLLGGRLRRP